MTMTFGGRRADIVYDALKRTIVLRNRTPGTQLREQVLAQELGCSQGTIREALINLAQDGLVDRSGYSGTFVTDTSLPEAAALIRVRLSIERSVARILASGDIDPMDEEMSQVFQAMDAAHAEQDFFLSSELDRTFHAALAAMAGMELLSPILQRCSLHIHRFTLGSVEVPRDFFQESGVGAEHRALFHAICTGSADEAEAAIVSHLDGVLQCWAPSLHAMVGREAFQTSPSGKPAA